VVHSAYPSNQIRLASYWVGLLSLVQSVDMDHMSSSSTLQGSFPSPCGAEASSSLLSEEDLLARLPQGRKVCVYVCQMERGRGKWERGGGREGEKERGREREWKGGGRESGRGEREREKGKERRRGGEFGKELKMDSSQPIDYYETHKPHGHPLKHMQMAICVGNFGSKKLIVVERKSIFLGQFENIPVSQDFSDSNHNCLCLPKLPTSIN